jgi:tripartite-type tricarboxylate transporter receptor subunit TctC
MIAGRRLTFMVRLGTALVFAMGACSIHAQATEKFPQRPIKWLVPYAAGGGLDAVTRIYAAELATRTGQPVIVDNRIGASGTIGIAAGVKAPADGYNLLSIENNAYTTHSLFYKNLTYNAPRDLRIVATLARVPVVLAVPIDHPAQTYKQFIDGALAEPGKVTYASPGVGTPQHIGMELMQSRTGAKMLHVPYKGASAMLTDLAGGRVQVALSDFGSIKPFYDAGKVRILAVATEKRLAALPNVPTFSESGLPDSPISIWHAVTVPVATPQAVVDALSAALEDAARSQPVRDHLAAISADSFFLSGTKVTEFASGQVDFWQNIVRPLNIRLD